MSVRERADPFSGVRGERPGYDPRALLRFLVLALPLVVLALALGHFAVEAAELVRPRGLPAPYLLGQWILEATGLTALFVLVRERGLGRWLAGLAGSWTAWIFRGPVLALTVAPASRLAASAWWHLVLVWLGVYTVCGLLMAAVARGLEERPGVGVERSPRKSGVR